MRVLVTGPSNPIGAALVKALADAGHEVRAFGIEPGQNPFAGLANVTTYPGWVQVGGSLEPVASECQALVHAANLDAAGDDKKAHAVHIERGTLYARYAAERELVQQFVALFPVDAPRAYAAPLAQAKAHAQATRKLVPVAVLEVADAPAAVKGVLAALANVKQEAAAPATT